MYDFYCTDEQNKRYKNNINMVEYVNNEKIIKKYELMPIDSRNSFYGKALLLETESMIYCLSYDTIVCGIDKSTRELIRYWQGYSATSMRHINSFLDAVGFPTLSKKEWCAY